MIRKRKIVLVLVLLLLAALLLPLNALADPIYGDGGGFGFTPGESITYNFNGADNKPAPVVITYMGRSNEAIVDISYFNAVKSTGFTFKEWNTAADGSGTAYKPGTNLIGVTLYLYAIWIAKPAA